MNYPPTRFAYYEGAQAEPKTPNPYKRGTLEHQEWCEGHEDAGLCDPGHPHLARTIGIVVLLATVIGGWGYAWM